MRKGKTSSPTLNFTRSQNGEVATYNRTFTYKTHPLNPDTDFDGQNDYNDLIPLDYDMDGDNKVRRTWLAYPSSCYYVERLALAINNDPKLLILG